MPRSPVLTTGISATLACQLEATAPKPGNVHRGADFEDLTLLDFLTCAALLAPLWDAAPERSLGQTVLAAVRASREAVGTNANLGIILLFAPLAKVASGEALPAGVARVLADLNPQDAADVFTAICAAQPGGLGQAAEADVTAPPTIGLVAAMQLAEERDLVARQYSRNFHEVFEFVLPRLREGIARKEPLARTIVRVHLQIMSQFPDSLIQRKCGPAIAQQSADRAAEVLRGLELGEVVYEDRLADLDFWLRADGHRRNPGTTADLLAAGLFALLRSGELQPPFRFYES